MKPHTFTGLLAGLCGVTFLVTSCQYEVPLAPKATLAIDPAILGAWEEVREKPARNEPANRMIILPFSATEYLVHYPSGGDDGFYYRAYRAELGGRSWVQLKVLGTAEGTLDPTERNLYHVAAYRLTNDTLEVTTLNPDVVSAEFTTPETLQQAFLEHRDHPDLFRNPGIFRRIGPNN